MSLAMPHTGRGVVSVPVGRAFAISSPVDCSVSISTNPSGDSTLGSVAFAMLKGGNPPTICRIPAGSPPVFLSGTTTDANGDVTPTQLTFIDSGASGI